MGRFSKTTQIKNNTDRAGFISAFNDIMVKRGFVPCAEDEAAKSYLLAFSEGGWVIFTSESEDVPQVAKEMNVTSFSVEVVDSDFAILTLNNGDTVIFGDGSGYGIEDSPKGERKFWEPLLADGKTWEQFSEVRDKNEVFVEDALCEAAPILGIDTKYIIADYNELLDMAEDGGNIETLYFKEKAADKKSKPMTLNVAFVKVFGEGLEPLGFKRLKNIKNKQPYYVRVINNEILHIITYRQMSVYRKGYKNIEVLGGAVTLYRRDLEFLNYTLNPQDWLQNTNQYFRFCDIDVDKSVMDSAIQFNCNIWGVSFDRAISSIMYYGQDSDPENLYRDAFIRSIGEFICKDDNTGMLAGMENAFNVTKAIILAILDRASDLKTCANYFFNDDIRAYIDLAPLDDFINNERYCTSEGRTLIKARFDDDGVARMEKSIDESIKFSSSNITRNEIEIIRQRCNEEHETQTALRFEMLDNPELNKRVLEECERVKAKNIEILKSYGLEF